MLVDHLRVGMLACNCTIIGDEESREAIVVDGGDGADEVLERLDTLNLRAKYLVHTHAHIDHIREVGRLREATRSSALLHHEDLPLYRDLGLQAQMFGLGAAPQIVDLDAYLVDGEALQIGSVTVNVLHTPGHTPGSVCFEMHEGGRHTILSGDTLFRGGIGRWDIGGTSMEDIVSSIHRKLLDFNDDTVVVPGHGPFTTIGTERTSNPYLQASP
ncbi:MAG: MBL fold metallo-hydrolase [Candidatus Eremiobacteraeota bacterium]|nr:MBL fold metallo-hydrolase [Candidatus Eremiobacteraeota bacterium]